MTKTKENSNIIAVITMIFLFGMISFVTNLAAPIGNIWKMQPGIDGSNTLGMMGNMMNFLAYAIMGIPAGALLKKKGYKFTAEAALLVGLLGVFVQFLSGVLFKGALIGKIPASFIVYLLGAFICGFSVCMLNTVVNPMLKILGGKRSNQYIQIGGSFNSLMGTLTPMLVGAMIGTLTKDTLISDVNTLLFMAMGVFAVAFVILLFVPIQNPEAQKVEGQVENPMKYLHFVLGAIAIFVYVGVEVGIPGTLNFYLSDSSAKGAGLDPAFAAKIAGVIAGVYWLLMLVGRLTSSVISGKVSSKTQLTCVSSVALLLLIAAIILPKSATVKMNIAVDVEDQVEAVIEAPDCCQAEAKLACCEAQNAEGVAEGEMPAECCAEGEKPAECCEADKACQEGEACDKPCCEDKAACDKHCEEAAAAAPVSTHKEKVPANIPVAAILLVLCGLCTSVMWGTIFDLSVEGLGTATEKASGIFMAMVVGGGILPLIQNFVADKAGYMTSYWVLVLGVAFILYFAIIGSKVKKN